MRPRKRQQHRGTNKPGVIKSDCIFLSIPQNDLYSHKIKYPERHFLPSRSMNTWNANGIVPDLWSVVFKYFEKKKDSAEVARFIHPSEPVWIFRQKLLPRTYNALLLSLYFKSFRMFWRIHFGKGFSFFYLARCFIVWLFIHAPPYSSLFHRCQFHRRGPFCGVLKRLKRDRRRFHVSGAILVAQHYLASPVFFALGPHH